MKRNAVTAAAAGACVAGAIALAYANSLRGELLFDDRDSILANQTIRHLADWRRVLSPPGGGVTVSGRPLVNLSLAINWAWSGPRLWSYHVVNIAGHILAALVLLALARRTLRRCPAARGHELGLATAIALLWGLHPLQTESVTYLIQRTEMMMGLFYLAVLYSVVCVAEAQEAGRTRSARVWTLLAVLLSLAGMGSKEVMASAPIVAFLFDAAFFAGTWREAWRRRRFLWLGLAASWILLAFEVAGTHGRGGTSGFNVGVSPAGYWWTQGPAIVRYFWLALWPGTLVLDYGFQTEWMAHPLWALPAVLAVLALVVWSVRLLFRVPRWGWLGIWFLAILAPTSLVPGARQSLAEHRMYLALAPLIGGTVVGVWLLSRARLPRWILMGAVAGVAAGYAMRDRVRNDDYADPERMWKSSLRAAPMNPYAHVNLGAAYLLNGRLEDAEREFRRALEINAGYAGAESNLGMILQAKGKSDEAMAHFRRALRLNPHYPQAANNLGVALASQKRWSEALDWYRQALAMDPDYAEAQANVGDAYRALGDLPRAEANMRRSVEIDPQRPETHYNLGVTLRQENRLAEAEAEYARALQLKPHFAVAEANWGVALALQNRHAEALQHFDAAVAEEPDNAEAYLNRGLTLQALGRVADAAADYRSALRCRPGYGDALADLGSALLALNRPAEAVAPLTAAAKASPQESRIPYDLGLAYKLLGRNADAAAQYRRALALDPDLPEAANNLAVALAAEGQLTEAETVLRGIIARHPDFASAHRNLGLILRATRREGEAAAEIAAAARLEAR